MIQFLKLLLDLSV